MKTQDNLLNGIEESTIRRKIEKYFQSGDKNLRKLGQRMCHKIGIDYWIAIEFFKVNYSFYLDHQKQEYVEQYPKMIKTPVQLSCFKIEMERMSVMYTMYPLHTKCSVVNIIPCKIKKNENR